MKKETTYKKVCDILEKDTKARDNDKYLYLCFCKAEGIDLTRISAEQFFLDDKKPNYDTISRCRRLAQCNNPFLLGSEVVQNYRAEQEEAMRQFVGGIK